MLRKVFLPYLIVSIASHIALVLYIYLFDYQLDWFDLRMEVLKLYFPLFTAGLAITLWVRPQLRILKPARFRGKRSSVSDSERSSIRAAYTLCLVACLGASLAITVDRQTYLNYSLIEVENSSEIANYPEGRYFKINNLSIQKDEKYMLIETTVESTRYSDRRRINMYYLFPFQQSSNVWYGFLFSKSVNYNDLQYEYPLFEKECDKKLANYNFSEANYFTRVEPSLRKDRFVLALLEKYPNADPSDHTVLMPSESEFPTLLGALYVTVLPIVISSTVAIVLIVIPGVDTEQLSRLERGEISWKRDLDDVIKALSFNGENKATAILLYLFIGYFIYMILNGYHLVSLYADDLVRLGALRRTEVTQGDYWRFLTHPFVSIPVFGVIMDIWGVYLNSKWLNSILGNVRVIFVFFFSAILSGLIAVLSDQDVIVSGGFAGVSALFGIVVYVYSAHEEYFEEHKQKKLDMQLFLVAFVFYAVFLGFLLSPTGLIAPLVGFLLGLFFGFLWKRVMEERYNDMWQKR